MQLNSYIKKNPTKLVANPHVTKKLLPTITDEQVQLLTEPDDSLWDKYIVSLLVDNDLKLC